MFRIRRIFDDVLPVDSEAIIQIQAILRDQFPLLDVSDIDKVPDQLRNPLRYNLRYYIHAAEDQYRRVKGFSLLAYAPDLKFCYLDYISAAPRQTGGGIGGSLYERVRDECRTLGVHGLFFECLPDDPELCPDPVVLKENRARLRFYERYGARPLINTAYETPLKPGDTCAPYLVFDDLGQARELRLRTARRIVRAILERKYADVCPAEYVDMVVHSLKDDPVRLRPPRYPKRSARLNRVHGSAHPIALVVTDKHDIHHVRERGYVESPVRIRSLLKTLEPSGLFQTLKPDHYGLHHITELHEAAYVSYFRKACSKLEPGKSIYPYVFPIRNAARPPKELPVRAGYYCIDTFTPLNQNAFTAARRAVDCALTASDGLLEGGFHMAYALVRPPGHHAERRAYGGFCYFNSAAIAAQHLSHRGRVAVLDIDYHHGNGTQDIFYERNDVLTLSIHGHPSFAYPYFSGFAEEKGAGTGEGYNFNLPLPEHGIDGERYGQELARALRRITRFKPRFLVVSLGLDTAKGDPTGTWLLGPRDFTENGRLIGRLGLPTLIVQEGGYSIRSLGINAYHFFSGLHEGAEQADGTVPGQGRNRGR